MLIVTLTLALVAVGVIWALSTIEGERNRTLNQYVLNEENGIYSQIVLYLDSFDLDNKTLHAYIHNDVGRRLRPDPGAIDPYDSLGNITILPLELTPAYYNPQLYIDPDDDVIVAGILAGPRWTLNPHNWHNVI